MKEEKISINTKNGITTEEFTVKGYLEHIVIITKSQLGVMITDTDDNEIFTVLAKPGSNLFHPRALLHYGTKAGLKIHNYSCDKYVIDKIKIKLSGKKNEDIIIKLVVS